MNQVQGPVNHSLHKVLETFSTEIKSGRPDYRTLLDLMHTVNMLFHKEFASANRQDMLELLDEIRFQVAAVVSAHNKLGRTIALIASGAASAGGGAFGAAGAFYDYKPWMDLGQNMAPLSKAPEVCASLFNDWKDAGLEEQRALQKELETKQGMVKQDTDEHTRLADQATQAAQETDRLFRELMSTFSQPVSAH